MTAQIASVGKSERDIAADIREGIRAKLGEIALLMDDANRAGMRVEFGMAVDSFGRNVVSRLVIVKEIRDASWDQSVP